MNNQQPTVSVVIPVRNETKYIRGCLDSLLKQDYPKQLLEVILVDGMSEDNTVDIIDEYIRENPYIKRIQNPHKTVQYAVNLGIKAASGEYIVRFDAHTDFAPDYISKCIEYHLKTDADNIGGPTIVAGKNQCQRAVAAAYYSSFALGGGTQHIEGYEGYSDTVSFGSFKKSTAEEIGLFDERLVVNEDDDFNFRLIEHGKKVFITDKIKSVYYPRDSYKGLFKQYYMYGLWKVAVIKKHKKPARLSHLVPVCFFMFLVFGAILSVVFKPFSFVYFAMLALYLILNTAASLKNKHADSFSLKLRLIYIHFILHFSYGFGFFIGLFKFAFYKF